MSNETEMMEYMYESYLKHINGGVYIDVGANNGIYHSTTKLLYDNNWIGYNIEANIHSYNELIKNRINDNNFNIALSDKIGTTKLWFYESQSSGKMVGAATIETRILNGLRHRYKWTSHDVNTLTYTEFIKTNNIIHVDFLNLDVEGHEMKVLENMITSTILPKVICIEIVAIDTKKLNELLCGVGYIKDDTIISKNDWIYVKK